METNTVIKILGGAAAGVVASKIVNFIFIRHDDEKFSPYTGALVGVGAVLLLAAITKKAVPMQGYSFAPEDPTGGAYAGGGDPIYGDPLGPGVDIGVASEWFGTLKPRGFVAYA